MKPETAPTTPPDAPRKENSSVSALWRLSGIGFELAASILGAVLAGWLLDRWLGTSPMWMLIGAGVGIIGGGYNFIRAAMKMNRQAIEEYRRARHSSHDADRPRRRPEEAPDHDDAPDETPDESSRRPTRR